MKHCELQGHLQGDIAKEGIGPSSSAKPEGEFPPSAVSPLSPLKFTTTINCAFVGQKLCPMCVRHNHTDTHPSFVLF